jgi:predicted HTH transcriptional regulator
VQKARERLAEGLRHVDPLPQVTSELVHVDGKDVLVVDVGRGSEFPYLANGLATIRRDDDVVPLTPPQLLQSATERGGVRTDDPTMRRLMEAVAKIEERTRRMRTIPISAACAVLGAAAGYLLKVLDPIKDLF